MIHASGSSGILSPIIVRGLRFSSALDFPFGSRAIPGLELGASDGAKGYIRIEYKLAYVIEIVVTLQSIVIEYTHSA